MLLFIHNLPPNINHREIENLIVSECGISSVILDNLVREGSSLRVTVGLIDEEDAAIVMRKMNGFYLGEYQLFVEDVRKKPISNKSYESSQTRLQREYQLFLEDVFKNSTSEQPNKSSKTRPQNLPAATNRGPSKSDSLIKTLLPTPLPQSKFQDQQYGHSSTYDDPNNSFNQATHLLNRTQALESFISHLGQNSEQQQKSRYEPSNYVSSTNRDFRNNSRDLQSSSSKSDRYSPSDFSQRSGRNDDARVVRKESKNSRGYMHEGQRRLERSRSRHKNTASLKVSDRREYPRQNEPLKKQNMNSRSVSGILKRRASPSGSQMQKSKYSRKDPPPAVFSSSQSTLRKSPPTRKHKESYNQASFSNPSSDVGIKSLLDLKPIQPPVFMTDLNKIVRNLVDEFQFGINQLVLPNISQPTASAEFGVSNQDRNSYTGNTKPFISPWDPNFVQFENQKFKKNEAKEALNTTSHRKPLFEDDLQRRIAVNKIVKQINFDDAIKIRVPAEPTVLDTVEFRKNFVKELKLEVRRRIDKMLFSELGVPVQVIVERYKNKYDLNHHRKLLKNINNKTNRVFVFNYNKTMTKSDTEKSGSKIQKTFKHPSKTMQDETTKECIYPQIPQWFCDVKKVAVHVQKRSKKAKEFICKKIFNSIKRSLYADLIFCAKAGYEMDENAQTDTLTPHLQNYQIEDENLLVITTVEGADLPEFRPLHDFLKVHNVIGLRKFTTRNICLALLKSKGDCEKLYAMKKTIVGGKVVTFLPIAEATDFRVKTIQRTNETEMNDNNKDGEMEMKSEQSVQYVNTKITSTKHTTVDKNKSVIENKTKVVKSAERINTQNVTEEVVKSTQSIKKEPGAVTGNSELTEKHKIIEKSPKLVSENSEIASNIENSSTLKAKGKPLVDKEMVNIIDTLPDELLSDDDIEVNMDELEDY